MKKFYSESPVIRYIPIDQLKDSPHQPRVNYSDIEELAESIKNIGLREDVLVRPLKEEFEHYTHEIVHGHRRLRALRFLGAKFVRCNVQEMGDKEAIEVALHQNIQREDLNPIEEGRAFKEYIEIFGISQNALARKIGKRNNLPYVNKRIRLLDLPEEIQTKIASGAMSFSNALALLVILDRKNDIIDITTKIDKGELKGVLQVKDAVESVKAGIGIEKAVEIAKLQDFQREMAKKISSRRSIKEILEGIRSRQTGPEVILEAQRKNNLNIVREMLERGLLVCPECGESHLSCMHCGRKLLEDSDNHD